MAESTVQTNNELLKFQKKITIESFRRGDFSAYMGNSPTSIIHRCLELTSGGKQINIPLLEQLRGSGTGAGPLTGNEEALDDYGYRCFVDWARNAVTTNKDELQKESAKVYSHAGDLLTNWIKNLQRNEIIEALMALPVEAAPTGLGSDAGDRVNGLRFESATDGQLDTWATANSDRILYGRNESNYATGDFSASLANVDSADTLNGPMLLKMKGLARKGDPRIAPVRANEGDNREYYTAFCGTRIFNDLAASLETINADARPRNVSENPLFQDGDLLYRGVIVREFPEIDEYTDGVWTTLATAGASNIPLNPIFLCGQSALAVPYGQMPKPTKRSETDYDFKTGVGIEMCYGVGKIFKASLVGCAHFAQLRTTQLHHVGETVAAADFNEMATRDNHLASLRGRSER